MQSNFKKLIIAHSYRLSCIRKEKQKEARSKLNKLLQGLGVTTDGGEKKLFKPKMRWINYSKKR